MKISERAEKLVEIQTHIKTEKELFDVINGFKKGDKLWFRGHRDVNWVLLPSADRNAIVYKIKTEKGLKTIDPFFINECFYNDIEKEQVIRMWKCYYQKTDIFSNYKNNDLILNLQKAQHRGLKTPLLDWSEDAFVALFFATLKLNDGECALFVLKPEIMNEILGYNKKIYEAKTYVGMLDKPLAIKGSDINDERIVRQSGNFIVGGNDTRPLEFYDGSSNYLRKIIIPNDVAKKIKNTLEVFGFNENNVLIGDDILKYKDINEEVDKKIEDMLDEMQALYKNNKNSLYIRLSNLKVNENNTDITISRF